MSIVISEGEACFADFCRDSGHMAKGTSGAVLHIPAVECGLGKR